MNRGRKGGFNSKFNEDIPDELRCKRSDGKQWRCNARAMENKTLCEKHYNQAKKRVAGVSSPSSTFSPKKKLKRKEEPKTTRTSNRDVEVRSKSSRTMTTDSSDYRYSNDSQYASEYRSFGDYSHISDYQSAGEYGHTDDHRTRTYSGSSKKKVDGQKMHMSPVRDAYFFYFLATMVLHLCNYLFSLLNNSTGKCFESQVNPYMVNKG